MDNYEIGNRLVEYRDTFVARCSWMHGDADNYTKEDIKLTEQEVLGFYNFWKACEGEGSESAGGPGYYHLPDWNIWGDFFPAEDNQCNYKAAVDSMEIVWYDSNGLAYEVIFK